MWRDTATGGLPGGAEEPVADATTGSSGRETPAEIRPSARLVSHTPEPETAVALAARLCYSKSGLAEVVAGLTEAETASFIDKLREAGHLSPLEHASFQFYIEGSRAMLAQLTRHRIASYSVQSMRYVAPGHPEYVVPPLVRRDEARLAVYRAQMDQAFAAYHDLLARGVPAEDARMVLGQGVATRLVCTFNARSLHNFFRLRCCRRAQWEIRQIAYQMRREVRRVAPALFSDAGPACESLGHCTEGRFSCGRHRFLGRIGPAPAGNS